MGIMSLYQVISMRTSTPQSGRHKNTLNFTLTWCKIHTMSLLCLKHNRRERKGVVPLINVPMMMIVEMFLMSRIFLVMRKRIELKVA